MNASVLHGSKRKVLAVALAALLPLATANAWYGAYGPGGWGCDPQAAFLEEYGFLDRFGPSRNDIRRLQRDEYWAATGPTYYGGYTSEDPVSRAVRKQCRGGWYRGWRTPYYW